MPKKITQLPGDKKDNKEKYRVAIRMVTEVTRKHCEDLVMSSKTHHQYDCGFNKMVRIINDNDIADVTKRFCLQCN